MIPGRVRSVRLLGSKLMFLDIGSVHKRLQAMIEVKKLPGENAADQFKSFKKLVREGDFVCKWWQS